MTSSYLSGAVWRSFFHSCRVQGVKSASVPLVLQVLASPLGLRSGRLPRGRMGDAVSLDVARLCDWRRKRQWVTSQRRRGLGSEVIYQPTARLQSAFDLPPAIAARLRAHILALRDALAERGCQRPALRLINLLLLIEAGTPLRTVHIVKTPFMDSRGVCGVQQDLALMARFGLVRRTADQTACPRLGRWELTAYARRVLHLPPRHEDALHAVQPYTNRNAA